MLDQALTNRSAVNEHRAQADNERLEFLGDALINMVVAEYLFQGHPDWSEGELTPRRAAAVSATSLALVARRLELGRLLRLGRGEAQSGVRQLDSVLSSTFEAVASAVYLSLGYEAAGRFIRSCLQPVLAQADQLGSAIGGEENFKSRWQEWAQQHLGQTPTYRVVEVSGPPHRPWFKVETLLGEECIASGDGPSTKLAEQRAARDALNRMQAAPRENPPSAQ